jgi:arylsulfatase A-like enzyme
LEEKPNLLFIFPDQFRAQSMGFVNEDPVHTPSIDRLASEGMVFTNAVSNRPLCSPYRAMLMTGKYPFSNGVQTNVNTSSRKFGNFLKDDEICFGDVLKANGYLAGYIGKWHLDAPGGPDVERWQDAVWGTFTPPGPKRHGFDFWHAYGCHNRHDDPYYWETNVVGGKSDGGMYESNEFSSKHEARTIIDYLKNNRQQRDTNKPFCITWSLNPPHPPYNNTDDCEEDSYRLYKNMTHDKLFNRPNSTGKASDLNARVYFANVTSTDKYIGQVIDTLDALGLGNNTLVVFTSDHGEMLGSHSRMQKNCEYEEAFGVPLIVRYPEVVQHKIEDLIIGTTDLYPTFLGFMGLSHLIPEEVAGTDYSDIIKNTDSGAVSRPVSTPFISIEGNKKGVRTAKYTFTVYGDGSVTLFNNLNDPYQQINLQFNSLPAADQMMLRQELGYWLKLSHDPWVTETKNPHFINYSYNKY